MGELLKAKSRKLSPLFEITCRIQTGMRTRYLGNSYWLHDHLWNISRKNGSYVFILIQLYNRPQAKSLIILFTMGGSVSMMSLPVSGPMFFPGILCALCYFLSLVTCSFQEVFVRGKRVSVTVRRRVGVRNGSLSGISPSLPGGLSGGRSLSGGGSVTDGGSVSCCLVINMLTNMW